MSAPYQPLSWSGNRLRILDQTRLPQEEVYIETDDYRVVAAAIRRLAVRGAPAIGVAGAYGIALGALGISSGPEGAFFSSLEEVFRTITGTRPTARNLFWAAGRMEKAARGGGGIARIKESLVAEAVAIHAEEADCSRRVSEAGAALLPDGSTVLTHCNTGPLATTGSGTALGVIVAACRQGKHIEVFVDETRPLLQGARLTTWELQKAGVPFTLITDSMAGHFMARHAVDAVIVGADRIAANGDTANKVGTYSLAVLAKAHGLPFYVAAPTSTIDVSLKTGEAIIIEERQADEITHIGGIPIATEGSRAANPAFDVTPGKLITALITEKGIVRQPLRRGIRDLFASGVAG